MCGSINSPEANPSVMCTHTHTENWLYSEVREGLYPAAKLEKWKIFAYSYILEFVSETGEKEWEPF